jgi:hypothetical protein
MHIGSRGSGYGQERKSISHHFDTQLAKEDPNLNVCDFYLFQGSGETTVMGMTVNPDVGLSAADTLHVEGLYAFRFDLDNDAREEMVFKFRFGQPRHIDGDEHNHAQSFQVRRATSDSVGAEQGELLLEGETGHIPENSGVRAFVGIAPDLFAGDPFALHSFLNAFYKDQKYDGAAFNHRQNYFAHRNVMAIVLEVPNDLIGSGRVQALATASLFGHAPEVRVSHWGLPLFTHPFLNDPDDQGAKERFNASTPSEDVMSFSAHIADFTQKMTTFAGSVADPAEYGKR